MSDAAAEGPALEASMDDADADAGGPDVTGDVDAEVGGDDVGAGDAEAGSCTTWSLGLDDAQILSIVQTHGGAYVITGSGHGDAGGGVFLTKFDACGNLVWDKQFVGGGDARGMGVAVDSSDDILLVGNAHDAGLDLGGGSLTAGTFAAKLTSSGAHLWSQTIVPGSLARMKVVVTPTDENLIAGTFSGTVSIGGGPPLTSTSVLGNVFALKLDANGQFVWSTQYGAAATSIDSVASDSKGGLWIGASQPNLPAATSLVHFDGTSANVGANTYSTSSNSAFIGMTVDGSGNLYGTGMVDTSIDVGCGALTDAGGGDIILFELSPTLNCLWSKRFGDNRGQFGTGIVLDALGNVAVTGTMSGLVDFGNASLNVPMSNVGGFLATFDPTGKNVAAAAYGYTMGGTNADVLAPATSGTFVFGGLLFLSTDMGQGVIQGASFLARETP